MLPLAGKTVVITRSVAVSVPMSEKLMSLGASVVSVPLIEVRSLLADNELKEIVGDIFSGRYRWIVFTSSNGANFLGKVSDFFSERRSWPEQTFFAAVGSVTAAKVRSFGASVRLVPSVALSSELVRAFPVSENAEEVLIVQADLASSELQEGLGKKGYVATRVDSYTTDIPSLTVHNQEMLCSQVAVADSILFASASSVARFVSLFDVSLVPREVFCIGPKTAAAAENFGIEVSATAALHTEEGLLSTVVSHQR